MAGRRPGPDPGRRPDATPGEIRRLRRGAEGTEREVRRVHRRTKNEPREHRHPSGPDRRPAGPRHRHPQGRLRPDQNRPGRPGDSFRHGPAVRPDPQHQGTGRYGRKRPSQGHRTQLQERRPGDRNDGWNRHPLHSDGGLLHGGQKGLRPGRPERRPHPR